MVLSPGCQTYLLNYWFLTSCYFSDGQPLNSVNARDEQQKSFLEGKGQDVYSEIKRVNFKSLLKDINFIYSLIIVGKIKIAGSFTGVLWKINYLLSEGGKKTLKHSITPIKLQIFPLSSLLGSVRFDSTAYSPRRKKAVWQNNHFCKLLHWRDRGLGFGKGKYPPYNLIPTATPDHHLQPDAQCRKEEGRNREPLETGSSPSHISFGALDQTPQITSQKRKPKNWTQRVFLSTLILSHWLFPARPFLAPDIVQGKSYSPSQGVKEKAANQLNRSWNLFIWKSLFFFCHLRDMFRNTLLTSFGRRTHLILHDSSLRLFF